MKISKPLGVLTLGAGLVLVVLACTTTKDGGESSSGASSSGTTSTSSSSGTSGSASGTVCYEISGFCNCYTGPLADAERELKESGGTRVSACSGSCCLQGPSQGMVKCRCTQKDVAGCAALATSTEKPVTSCGGSSSSSSSGSSGTTSSSSSSSGGSSSGCGEPCSAGCCSPSGRICCKPPFCSGDCAGSGCC